MGGPPGQPGADQGVRGLDVGALGDPADRGAARRPKRPGHRVTACSGGSQQERGQVSGPVPCLTVVRGTGQRGEDHHGEHRGDVAADPACPTRIGDLCEQPVQLDHVDKSGRNFPSTGSAGQGTRNWHEPPFGAGDVSAETHIIPPGGRLYEPCITPIGAGPGTTARSTDFAFTLGRSPAPALAKPADHV